MGAGQLIDSIMASLAPNNVGLASSQVPTALAQENIDAWMDHARTVMQTAGVCSINDLGRFRMQPLQRLKTGMYVAPKKSTGPLPPAKVLESFAFVETVGGTIHHYAPNEILHETAIV